MLVGKTFGQRYFYIDLICEKYLPHEDALTFFRRINEIKKLGRENNDRELEMEAELLQLNYFMHHKSVDSVKCVNMLKNLFHFAANENNTVFLARVNNLAGDYYWNTELNYEKAFEYYEAEYAIIKNLSVEEYPAKQKSVYNLGDKYWFFKDYNQTIRYMTEAYNTDIFGQSLYYTLQATNTVGLCYQKTSKLDSSDYFFLRANAIAVTVGNDAWDGITAGNLGYNYFLRGKYDTAAVLLQKDLRLSVNRQDWGCASGSLITLAELNLLKGNIKLATQQAQQARQWVKQTGEYPRLKSIYPLFSKLNERQGRADIAEMYRDSTTMVKDSLARKFSAMQVLRWKQKTEIQEEHETAQMREKFTTIALQSVSVIFISILLFVLGQKVYHRIRLNEGVHAH